MSDKETSWILTLINRITKPAKDIMATVKETTQVIDKNTDRVVFNEKQTKEALVNSKKYYKDLQQQVKENAKEVIELQKAYDKAAPGTRKMDAARPLLKSKKELEELRKELKEAASDIQMLETDLTKSMQKKQSWQGLMTGANQTMEVIQKVSGMLDFTNPIINTKNEIERMTSTSGKELEALVSKVHRIGKVFNENDDDIARAANTMQKTWGGSYNDMIKLLESGYEKGGNINKDLLKSMQEYPVQLKEAGLSASESMALIAQAGKNGVFSDKAIDSIKEANLSLKEMNKSQVSALKGIGISAQDLRGKTAFDAMKLISEKMQGATTEAQQKVLKDIFKSAGEDAGKNFILGLSSIDLNIDNLPNVQQAGAGIKGFLANIQSWAANTFGGAVPYIQAFGQASTGILGVISLFQALTKVTWIQAGAAQAAAVAQRVWNVAMVSNPIGAVLVAVAALGAAVYKITKSVRENSEAWKQQQSMMRINEELNKYAIQSTVERTTKLKLLTETAANEKLSLDRRKEALKELIKEDSRYQSALQDGIILTDKLRQTTAELTAEILRNAEVEGRRKLLVKAVEEVELAKLERQKQQKIFDNKTNFGLFVESIKDIAGFGIFPEYDASIDKLKEKERDRDNILKLVTKDEQKQGKKTSSSELTETNRTSLLDTPDTWFERKENKRKKENVSGREKNGMSISGGGSGKNITQHLTINNYFTRTGNSEDRSFADRIITQITDGLRDSVATI